MRPPSIVQPLAVLICLAFGAAAAADPPQADWFPQAPALPQPTGPVLRAANVKELYQAAQEVMPGGAILLADGHYRLPRYLELKTDNVSLRGESGDRHKVILDGAGSRHGELLGVTGASGVTIANLTIQNVKWNGIKINSDRGAERVTVYNCVLHNIWQRGIKAPAMPKEQGAGGPRDCRVQYCLFYNDRPKQFADDQTDKADTFNGNYIGGIDAKNTNNWTISDNVFLGIQGRTREGRGAIYISENGRGATIERNIFLDCDIAIALGNPSLGYSPLQAIKCIARNNFVSQCPETGILACYTRDCAILNNTIVEPDSRLKRLIWAQKSNAGLRVENNLLVGPPMQMAGEGALKPKGNVVVANLAAALALPKSSTGQTVLSAAQLRQAVEFPEQRRTQQQKVATALLQVGKQPPEVWDAMRKVHAGFRGQRGYVAQFGDSITHSMAFWTPMDWDAPDKYLTRDDGLPKQPAKGRWRDHFKGARDKGPKHANYSGWRVGQVLSAMDQVFERDKPEAAIVMVGTNDISGGSVPAGYHKGLEQIVAKCLAHHCVPILNTIPPRRGRDKAVDEANAIIRAVAQQHHVPLADYHAEILRLRPGDTWNGTLISADGVHPSGGKTNDYSPENLRICGYALRNWVNFLAYRQLYFHVLEHQDEEK